MPVENPLNTLRQIPNLIRRMPNPRRNPAPYLYYIGVGVVIAGSGFIGSKINEQGAKEAQKQAIAASELNAEKIIYNAKHNPPPLYLPDGSIETHINDAGQAVVTRYLTNYDSLDSNPQKKVPWKISDTPSLIDVAEGYSPNTIYVRTISPSATGEALRFLEGNNCQVVGRVTEITREGLITEIVPVKTADCLKPAAFRHT